jgi:hypothetical protein
MSSGGSAKHRKKSGQRQYPSIKKVLPDDTKPLSCKPCAPVQAGVDTTPAQSTPMVPAGVHGTLASSTKIVQAGVNATLVQSAQTVPAGLAGTLDSSTKHVQAGVDATLAQHTATVPAGVSETLASSATPVQADVDVTIASSIGPVPPLRARTSSAASTSTTPKTATPSHAARTPGLDSQKLSSVQCVLVNTNPTKEISASASESAAHTTGDPVPTEQMSTSDCSEQTGNDHVTIDSDHLPETAMTSTATPVTLEEIERLHRQLGHPSPAQIMSLLRNSETLTRAETQQFAKAIRELHYDFCARRARRRTPLRPVIFSVYFGRGF